MWNTYNSGPTLFNSTSTASTHLTNDSQQSSLAINCHRLRWALNNLMPDTHTHTHTLVQGSGSLCLNFLIYGKTHSYSAFYLSRYPLLSIIISKAAIWNSLHRNTAFYIRILFKAETLKGNREWHVHSTITLPKW